MKTFKELKDFCEKNHVRYETNPLYSKPTMVEQLERDENGKIRLVFKEHRTLLGFEMGMNNIAGRKGRSEWQWVWFETLLCVEELTDDCQMIFRNRYSMVNGCNHEGWREAVNAVKTIERRS